MSEPLGLNFKLPNRMLYFVLHSEYCPDAPEIYFDQPNPESDAIQPDCNIR